MTGAPVEPNESDLLGKWPPDNNRTAMGSENARVWGGGKKVLFVNGENLSQLQSVSFEIHTDLDSNYGAAAASHCITLNKEMDVSELHHPCLENGAKIALMS